MTRVPTAEGAGVKPRIEVLTRMTALDVALEKASAAAEEYRKIQERQHR